MFNSFGYRIPKILLNYSVLFSLTLFMACTSTPKLTKTPTLYKERPYPAEAIPEKQRTTQPKLYFITDRFLADVWTNEKPYTAKRSPSMAFGTVTVSFGKGKTWEDLVRSSNTIEREKDYPLRIVDADELIRFPSTPLLFSVADGRAQAFNDPAFRTYEKRKKEFKATLSNLLSGANKKEVVLFVHGFNNKFDDAAYAMANLWHFSGRIGVPLFFTWPAGAAGIFGYLTDRESGEYSIYHLKETLRLIAATPGFQKLHIIAHSRGTDVVTTALRELIIETRASGSLARERFKIANLILAAPDLDFGIVRQRLIAERIAPAFGQITIYVNKNDGALRIAQKLAAGQRTGSLSVNDLENIDRAIYARTKNIHFIDVENSSSGTGHAYFRENPNVISDIALTLQTSAKPGTTSRPLVHISGNFWRLSKYYPYDLDFNQQDEKNTGPRNEGK